MNVYVCVVCMCVCVCVCVCVCGCGCGCVCGWVGVRECVCVCLQADVLIVGRTCVLYLCSFLFIHCTSFFKRLYLDAALMFSGDLYVLSLASSETGACL